MEQVEIKRMYKSELACQYNVSLNTLKRWFIKANISVPFGKAFLSKAKIREIYAHFGEPDCVK